MKVNMKEGAQIVLSPEMYLMQLENARKENLAKDETISRLRAQLEYERLLRESTQHIVMAEEPDKPPGRAVARRTRREVDADTNTYSEFKSDGKRKAHAADAIRSYDDFCAIQNYFIEKGDVRDYAMWTIGVSFGIRISDLLMLRFGNIIDKDKSSFKPRVAIYEKKTGKLNNMLITESVRDAMSKYIDSIGGKFELEGFLFPSRKTGGQMCGEHGWRIISSAGRAVGLPINIGSHTMRKSFANIAACVDKSCIDMNAVAKIQGLLNHSDQRVTMRYLGTYQQMFDRARMAVSDFVLGRTGINELVAGDQYTIDDIMDRLDEITKQKEGNLS